MISVFHRGFKPPSGLVVDRTIFTDQVLEGHHRCQLLLVGHPRALQALELGVFFRHLHTPSPAKTVRFLSKPSKKVETVQSWVGIEELDPLIQRVLLVELPL